MFGCHHHEDGANFMEMVKVILGVSTEREDKQPRLSSKKSRLCEVCWSLNDCGKPVENMEEQDRKLLSISMGVRANHRGKVTEGDGWEKMHKCITHGHRL